MTEISITLRGFSSPAQKVADALEGDASHFGNKGEDYRGKAGKRLSKSYVVCKLAIGNDIDIGAGTENLISNIGGYERLSEIVNLFSVEDIYLEIYMGRDALENGSGGFLSSSTIKSLSMIGAGVGFSWSLSS